MDISEWYDREAMFRKGEIMKDKNGIEIKEGDYIFNESDKYEYYQVVNINNRLCIEDENSPIEMFRPQDFWEIRNTDVAKHSVQRRKSR